MYFKVRQRLIKDGYLKPATPEETKPLKETAP